MHQPSWSYASSITQSSWRWSYQHGKSYGRWLHHTPINTQKDYHASTFMIIRIKHNPTIWALFQLNLISRAQWSLVKIKTALRIMINIGRCHQTSRWSLIITADIVPALGSLRTFRPSRNSSISVAIWNAKEVWSTSVTKNHTVFTPKYPSWLRYLRFSVIENKSLRSTCKIVFQPSVTFVHPSQCTKTKAFDHKITWWRYLCFTFNANTTTAVVHRSSHSFIGVV